MNPTHHKLHIHLFFSYICSKKKEISSCRCATTNSTTEAEDSKTYFKATFASWHVVDYGLAFFQYETRLSTTCRLMNMHSNTPSVGFRTDTIFGNRQRTDLKCISFELVRFLTPLALPSLLPLMLCRTARSSPSFRLALSSISLS